MAYTTQSLNKNPSAKASPLDISIIPIGDTTTPKKNRRIYGGAKAVYDAKLKGVLRVQEGKEPQIWPEQVATAIIVIAGHDPVKIFSENNADEVLKVHLKMEELLAKHEEKGPKTPEDALKVYRLPKAKLSRADKKLIEKAFKGFPIEMMPEVEVASTEGIRQAIAAAFGRTNKAHLVPLYRALEERLHAASSDLKALFK
ncbi:MAG: hypothetical protein KGH49_00020 [Candidatus Micrarchaeota archaeon]|nr:hypothetical protein [Candidatus Micrarchaeota archaeon]